MQALRSTLDGMRDRWAPINRNSTFRSTGQITPDEFLAAGDYLVYKFPTWSWAAASTPAKGVNYLPPEKQYLVTRGVPCHRRLDAEFAGTEEYMVKEGDGFEDSDGQGWLSTGGDAVEKAKVGDVRALGDKGEIEAAEEEEEEIPDMEDDDDEAIIRDQGADDGKSPTRTYNIYITYTPYYRTPRTYLSGYTRPSAGSASAPLPPQKMLEDIVGDYKDKTVTLEDFPFFDTPVKMASIHPCKHASTMKSMLDRSESALKLQRDKVRSAAKAGREPGSVSAAGLEGLVDATDALALDPKGSQGQSGAGAGAGAAKDGDEWEVLQHDAGEDEVSIRVDQYLVVFIKFMASVTPGIEHDFTMGV